MVVCVTNGCVSFGWPFIRAQKVGELNLTWLCDSGACPRPFIIQPPRVQHSVHRQALLMTVIVIKQAGVRCRVLFETAPRDAAGSIVLLVRFCVLNSCMRCADVWLRVLQSYLEFEPNVAGLFRVWPKALYQSAILRSNTRHTGRLY